MCAGCPEWMHCYMHIEINEVEFSNGTILKCSDFMKMFRVFEHIAQCKKEMKEEMKEEIDG